MLIFFLKELKKTQQVPLQSASGPLSHGTALHPWPAGSQNLHEERQAIKQKSHFKIYFPCYPGSYLINDHIYCKGVIAHTLSTHCATVHLADRKLLMNSEPH